MCCCEAGIWSRQPAAHASPALARAGGSQWRIQVLEEDNGYMPLNKNEGDNQDQKDGVEDDRLTDRVSLSQHMQIRKEKVQEDGKQAFTRFFSHIPMPEMFRRITDRGINFGFWFHNVEEPDREGNCLHDLVYSAIFQSLSNCAILYNLFEATIAADYEMIHGEAAESHFIHKSKLGLLIFYCVELFLKLAVHCQYFFINDNW